MVTIVVLLAAVLIVLLGLLIWLVLGAKKSRGRAEVEVQTGVEAESGRLVARSGHIQQQDAHRQTLVVDDGRTVWQISLENERDVHRSKCFCGELFLGRLQPGAEPANMLYLDEDATVSKQQCQIVALPASLAVRNCSRTSMTLVNGRPAAEPMVIGPGSILCMGHSKWRVIAAQMR